MSLSPSRAALSGRRSSFAAGEMTEPLEAEKAGTGQCIRLVKIFPILSLAAEMAYILRR
jgi:hypothetical protein